MSNLISRFKSSAKNLQDIRCLSITAMFVALSTAMTLCGLTLRLTPELRIDFGFICSAAISMLFGPVVGMISGFCTDILGYFAGNFSMGGYFPGYTLTAICGGLIYGLWLYHPEKTSISKKSLVAYVIGAKACINLICNIGLNTFWLTITAGKAMSVILPFRITKNLILLPFECIILYFAVVFVINFQKRTSRSLSK